MGTLIAVLPDLPDPNARHARRRQDAVLIGESAVRHEGIPGAARVAGLRERAVMELNRLDGAASYVSTVGEHGFDVALRPAVSRLVGTAVEDADGASVPSVAQLLV